MRSALLFVGLVTASFGFATPAGATDYQANDSNYRSMIGNLQAGDTLHLAAGTYTQGLPLSDLNGSPGSPIVITGPETGPRAIILGRSCCNTISLRRVSHVVIRHLDVDTQGEIVDGVKAESDGVPVHNVTLEYLNLYNFGVDQQVVGISTKCASWDMTIRYNTIYDAGTGLYLGNSNGNDPFVRGTIEHNLVVNPIGYGMQVKHQNVRASVSGMPTTDSVTLIRHNVFMKFAGASTGVDARPNLLVGSWPTSGPGTNDRYEIYGNLLYQNESGTEALFQGEGNVSFHDNVLVNSFGDGAWFVDNEGPPKELHIYNNTVYVDGTGFLVQGAAGGFAQLVVGNAIFASSAVNGGMASNNFSASVAAAGTHVVAPSFTLGQIDLYPRAGALTGAPIALGGFSAETDYATDFNGDLKDGSRRGAYAGEVTNPGWSLAEEIKPELGPLPDAGPRPDLGVIDSGNPQNDAGNPGNDAGTPGNDAGTPGNDAGTPGNDAGTNPQADAGNNPQADAGTRDTGGGGGEEEDPALEGGCGCSTTETRARSGATVSLLALAVGLVVSRRRR